MTQINEKDIVEHYQTYASKTVDVTLAMMRGEISTDEFANAVVTEARNFADELIEMTKEKK
tara:strand:+ start:144 stop:326 length:183 start_codon:yes stop_codon:yes gene_type:complete